MVAAWFPFVLSILALAISILSAMRVRQDRIAKFEAHYNDLLTKLTDSREPGAKSALELMREESRMAATRAKLGLQISGLVTAAAGLGTMIFLRYFFPPGQNAYLCGLIPLFIGIALFASSRLVKTQA